MKKTTMLLTLMALLIIPYILAVSQSGTTSSYTFTIDNCTAIPNATLTCDPALIRFQCDIYNPSFINTVNFRVEGSDYATSQNGSAPHQFFLNYNKPADSSSTTDPITLDREQVIDLNSQGINFFQVVNVPRNCEICEHEYTQTIIQACNTTNQRIVQYASNNESCAPSFNQTEACDFCQPNIFANYSECNTNGTRTVNYFDLNYNTCCLSTGLSEDCIINTPTYEAHNETCNFYTQEFTCRGDPTPVIDGKINVNCELPDDQNYSCIVNTYQGENFTALLATSPEYRSTSNFALYPTDQETRTSFSPQQRLLNAYYTDKSLRGDSTYKIQVKCTNSNTTLLSEYQITPTYDTPDYFTARTVWGIKNSNYIFLAIFLIAIGVLIAIWIVKKIRG